MKYEIMTIKLEEGLYCTTPANNFATFGTRPFPWQAALAETEEQSEQLFIEMHMEYMFDKE